MTKNPFSESRLLPVGLALLMVAVMLMLGWSHYRWDQTFGDSIVPLDQLADSRENTLAAEAFAERLLAGDSSIHADLVLARVQRALASCRQLRDGAGSLAGMHVGGPPAGKLVYAVDDYWEALNRTSDALRQRIGNDQAISGIDLRTLRRQMENAASRLEGLLLQDLYARRLAQHRLDAVNVSLLGVLGLLLLTVARRADLRQHKAHEALAASEERLRAFVAATPGISFLIDREGRYLEVSGREENLLAVPREQALGRTIAEIFEPRQAQEFMGLITAVLDSQQVATHIYELDIAGANHWFEARIAPAGGADWVIWLSWEVTERLRIEQRERALSRLYGFLSQVNQAIVWSREPHMLMQRVCAAAVRYGGWDMAWMGWLEEEGRSLRADERAGAEGIDTAVLHSPLDAAGAAQSGLGLALRTARAVRVPDLRSEAGLHPWGEAAIAAGLVNFSAVPLRRDGRVVGALCLLCGATPGLEEAEEGALLDEVGADLSFALTQFQRALEHLRSEERMRLHAAALESTRDGVLVTDLDTTIVSVNRAFTEITGYSEDEVLGETPARLSSGRHEEAFYRDMWTRLLEQGHWQGEICNRRKDGEIYTQWMSISVVRDPTGRDSHYVGVFTDITHLKETEARLSRLAHYDPLTGLPNRLLIHSRLEHALEIAERTGSRVAVLFIDLDNFKTVNDGLGHAAGDELLAGVAGRLRTRLRREDTLGRLGGDEFVLLLERLDEPQQAAAVAQELLDTLAIPFSLAGGHEVYAQASVGIGLYPDDGERADALIRGADAAMYQAKRQGRNTYRFYTEELTAAAGSRLAMETRLRRALEQNEFELFYQPQVDLRDGRVIGAEALVRLCPPGLEAIGPDTFIPLMEETGLIATLGDWVQREVCLQGQAWLAKGLDPGVLAVNVSTEEIRRGGVEQRLGAILADSGFPPQRLELEITESGLMEKGERAAAFLEGLRRLGVHLSIDDFGTGYSSLAYLKRFPVSKLKIDRSFIHDIPGDPNSVQLAATIVAMARSLGLSVLAEGVETEAQRAFLLDQQCGAYQGYLFSAPLPAHEYEAQFLLKGRR